MRKKTRIAVIGGVAAGPAAAAEAHRAAPDAEVVLYEQGPRISYGACEIPYFVAGWIDDAERLVSLTPERFEQTRGGVVKVNHRVVNMHPERGHLLVEDLTTGATTQERFDKIILAVGARARRPDFDGLDAPNVFTVRTLEDAIAVDAYLSSDEKPAPGGHAVILGGGYVGVEMAEALRERGLRVTILEPGAGVLHQMLPENLSEVAETTLRAHGVIVRRERATGVRHDRAGRVQAVLTDRGEQIGCQLVVVAIGITPRTEMAERAGIKRGVSGALAVDAQMRTNKPNVWACGDCAEVERVIDGAKLFLPLAPLAFRTARVAGRNAARQGRGTPARHEGVVGASAVKVFGLEVAHAGLRLDEAQAAGFDAFAHAIQHWSRVKMYPGAKPIHVQLVVERRRGRLLGGTIVGEDGAALRANVLVPLLRDAWTVDRIDALDLLYSPPFAPSHDPLLIAAHEAAKHVTF